LRFLARQFDGLVVVVVFVRLGKSAAHTLLAATNVAEVRSNVGGVLDAVRGGTLTP
jgi:hypothetical protein